MSCTYNTTEKVTIVSDTNDQDVSINKNYYITLCGTCPEVPYNIATHFCIDCKENICGDCSNGHRTLTRDHDISPLLVSSNSST